MDPTSHVCENPDCGKTFVVTRRYAKPKRYCNSVCMSRHASARRYLANKEQAKAQSRAWHEAHREEANARRRNRRLEHLDEERENVRRWHSEHPDEARTLRQQWYAKNGEAQRSKMRERYKRLAVEQPERLAREGQKREQRARDLYPWMKLLAGASRRAGKKGLEYSLTPKWAEARWTGRCELTDIPFDLTRPGTPGGRPFSPSIDRIDAAKGYTPENSRFVLWAINSMKSSGDNSKVLSVALAIAKSLA
jgi:hypothetical protein